jgi:AcrR family transcriptional regulator
MYHHTMTAAQRKSAKAKNTAPRFTKEAWLELGMDALRKHGSAGITIEKLTAQAGVTRGSFYWHFKGHDDFLVNLAWKWSDEFTQSVIDAASEYPDIEPRERLGITIIDILSIGKARLDVHFRELAITRPRVLQVVEHVDALRTNFVTRLFEEMGYTGEDLRTRVHAFVVLHSLEMFVHTGLGPGKDLEQVAEQRLQFFLS